MEQNCGTGLPLAVTLHPHSASGGISSTAHSSSQQGAWRTAFAPLIALRAKNNPAGPLPLRKEIILPRMRSATVKLPEGLDERRVGEDQTPDAFRPQFPGLGGVGGTGGGGGGFGAGPSPAPPGFLCVTEQRATEQLTKAPLLVLEKPALTWEDSPVFFPNAVRCQRPLRTSSQNG